jgi:hypothetical protein
MKRFTKNPFFYVSIVVIAVLVFQVAQIVRGQAGTWTGPPGPPTAGQPAPPIDVSDVTQGKSGAFFVGPSAGNSVQLRNEAGPQILFTDGSNNASIWYDPNVNNGQGALMARHDVRDPSGFMLGSGGGAITRIVGGSGVALTRPNGAPVPPSGVNDGEIVITATGGFQDRVVVAGRYRVQQSPGSLLAYPTYQLIGGFTQSDVGECLQKWGAVQVSGDGTTFDPFRCACELTSMETGLGSARLCVFPAPVIERPPFSGGL